MYREKAIEWILFDVWGVIYSISNFIMDLLIPFLKRKGTDLSNEEIYRNYRKASVVEIDVDQFWHNVGMISDVIYTELEYRNSFSVLDPEFKEIVKWLRPHFKLGIISNDVERWSVYLLEKYEISEMFKFVAISSSWKMRKSDPNLFKVILNKLGEEPVKCLFIDDKLENLSSAYNLGVRTIHFVRNKDKTPFCSEFEISTFQELKHLLNFVI